MKNQDHKQELLVLSRVQKLGFEIGQRISDQPWSTVWHARTLEGKGCVIKLIHDREPRQISFLEPLSRAFQDTCPKILYAEPSIGLFVYERVDKYSDPLSASTAEYAQLLVGYGSLQSKVAKNELLLEMVPKIDPMTVYEAVLELAHGADRPGNVFKFFDFSERQAISKAMFGARRIFSEFAKRLDATPKTINHTDLRLNNTISKGHNVPPWIIDWDDSVVSAPGWSLNMQFSGCLRVHASLCDPLLYRDLKIRKRDQVVISGYLASLMSSGVYEHKQLIEVLPATAAFGILKYALDMAPYEISDRIAETVIRSTVQIRFSDMFKYLEIVAPEIAATERGSATSDVNSNQTQNVTAGATFPEITYPETGSKPLENSQSENPKEGARLFMEHGALLLKNCLPRPLIEECFTAISNIKDQQEADMANGRALKVGDNRFMISLQTHGVFGSSDLLAPKRLLQVLDHILGSDYILGSLTSVLALPKSKSQRWHRDNDPLFPEHPKMRVPAFSVAVLIPLVPLDDEIGATEIIPGSHLDDFIETKAELVARPTISLGDCYIMDSRLLHRGMANKSAKARPVLSLVYQRPWYRDYQNFNNQSALTISEHTLGNFSERRRHLIEWASKS